MGRLWPAAGAENARRGRRNTALRSGVPFAVALTLGAPQARAANPDYETVVTAPPSPETAREDLTASASVITGDRTPRAGETLPQLVSELPGVTVTRYGSEGSLATLSVRGSAPNQVAVYVDGVPLASALTGSVDLGLVPLTAVQRIELYRGASPLGFGSSAMGGVVSLTSEAPDASGFGVHTGTGSFGTWLGGGDGAWVGARGSLVARVSAFHSRADFPYRSDNGTLFNPDDDRTLRRQNNQLSQRDAAVRGALVLPGRRALVLSTSVFDRDQGLPARATDQSYQAALGRRRLLASLRYDGADDLGPGGALSTTGYVLAGEQRLDDPLGEVSFTPTRTHDRSLALGATATGRRVLGPLLLSAMLDGRHERFTPDELLHAEHRPPGSRAQGAAGLQAIALVDALALELLGTVRAEVAHDEISLQNALGGTAGTGLAAKPADYVLPVARLGLVQTPHPSLRLRANAGQYARLPSLFERYGNGGTILGNPQLVPEKGLSADVGASVSLTSGTRALVLDGGIFGSRSRDLIHFQELGYFAGYTNVARARTLGAELSADGRLGRFARLFAQGTFIDARDRSGESGHDGRQLPLLPRLRAYARPELRALPLGGGGKGKGMTAGIYADADLTGGRYQDPANLVHQPGRVLFGAGGYLAYAPAGVRAVFSAFNLADARATDVLDFPLPGRSFFLTLYFAYPEKETPL